MLVLNNFRIGDFCRFPGYRIGDFCKYQHFRFFLLSVITDKIENMSLL